MEIGIIFPHQTIGTDPGVLREFAQRAESLNYSHVVVYDHVLGAVHEGRQPPLTGPYTEDDGFHEPLTLISWWAGLTQRIGFLTGILVLPQRQTALAAKQLTQIELVAPGRLRVGVGIGWNHVEYESLGIPFRDRGRRLEEQVHLLRRLWTEPVIDFTGAFHRIDRAGLLPLPASPPPIWFGGFSPAQFDRCGRLGDGFCFSGASSVTSDVLAEIRAIAQAAGRDPAALGFEATVVEPRRDWAALLAKWADDGGTTASLYPRGRGPEILENLSRYAQEFGIS